MPQPWRIVRDTPVILPLIFGIRKCSIKPDDCVGETLYLGNEKQSLGQFFSIVSLL